MAQFVALLFTNQNSYGKYDNGIVGQTPKSWAKWSSHFCKSD